MESLHCIWNGAVPPEMSSGGFLTDSFQLFHRPMRPAPRKRRRRRNKRKQKRAQSKRLDLSTADDLTGREGGVRGLGKKRTDCTAEGPATSKSLFCCV